MSAHSSGSDLATAIQRLRPDLSPRDVAIHWIDGGYRESPTFAVSYRGHFKSVELSTYSLMAASEGAVVDTILESARYCLSALVPTPPAGKWRRFGR